MRLILRRLLAAAAVLIAAVAFALAPSSPAQAKSGRLLVCVEVDNPVGSGTFYDCYWIEIPELGPKWPPDICPQCGVFLDFWKYDIDPVAQKDFNELFTKGFDTLARSHLTDDEKLAAQLRAEAAGHFLEAAKAVEKYPIELAGTGLWDPKNRKTLEDPSPLPWLPNAGAEIAAGIGLLQADLWDPQPDPPVDAALAHFDKAYDNLSDLAAQ
ncbi:hypothetical protein GCM10009830_16620 [Glycomyces endophyticus]|uniref:Uncharacterized protein n=1 Tax=Glycomyces endophyticus TaxID=480996 RepID=A0ABN2GHC9_9ACTN